MELVVGETGDSLGQLSLVIALGAIFGMILQHAGAAQRIAVTLVERYSDRTISWGLGLAGFLVATSVYIDVAIVVLVPMLYGVAQRAAGSGGPSSAGRPVAPWARRATSSSSPVRAACWCRPASATPSPRRCGTPAFPLVVFGFIVSAVMRISQGSGLVAMVTGATFSAPLAESLGASPATVALTCIAIACGGAGFSHVNDSGFWMANRYFGMDGADTLKSWTVMKSLVGLTGFAVVLLLSTVVS